MWISIIISVYSIFVLTSIGTMIKNVFFNQNAFSREIRFFLSLISLGYIGFIIMSLIFLINQENILIKILFISLFLSLSILMLFSMVETSSRKASVRDAWKYRSKNIESYNSIKPKSYFDIITKFLLCFFIFVPIFIVIAIFYYIERNYFAWVLLSWTIFHIIVNHIMLQPRRRKLIKSNVKYNELKQIILLENKDTFNEKTLRGVGLETLKLYDNLFIKSSFYKNSTETNDAIVTDIALKTKLNQKDYSKYLTNTKYNTCKKDCIKKI